MSGSDELAEVHYYKEYDTFVCRSAGTLQNELPTPGRNAWLLDSNLLRLFVLLLETG